MLLARERHLDELLHDAGVERHAPQAHEAVGPVGEDLERALLERRRHLDGDRFLEQALTGEAIALADEVVAELHLVHHGRWRDRALQELHATGGAAAPSPARGRDVDTAGVGRLQDGGARRGEKRPARRRIARVADDRESHGHAPTF
jgi:hypothetical protein